jgi:hypothetical protein
MKDEATQAFLDIFLKCLEYETFIDLARDKKKREYFSFVLFTSTLHLSNTQHHPSSHVCMYMCMVIGDEFLWSNAIGCTSKSSRQTLMTWTILTRHIYYMAHSIILLTLVTLPLSPSSCTPSSYWPLQLCDIIVIIIHCKVPLPRDAHASLWHYHNTTLGYVILYYHM